MMHEQTLSASLQGQILLKLDISTHKTKKKNHHYTTGTKISLKRVR